MKKQKLMKLGRGRRRIVFGPATPSPEQVILDKMSRKCSEFDEELFQRGVDWDIVCVSDHATLYMIEYHQGTPSLHIEDVSSGNCSDKKIASETDIGIYQGLPVGLQNRLRCMLVVPENS